MSKDNWLTPIGSASLFAKDDATPTPRHQHPIYSAFLSIARL